MLTSWMSLENWHMAVGMVHRAEQQQHNIRFWCSLQSINSMHLAVSFCLPLSVHFLRLCRLTPCLFIAFFSFIRLVCSFVHSFRSVRIFGIQQWDRKQSPHIWCVICVCVWISRFIRKSVPKWHLFAWRCYKCVERICRNQRKMRSCLRRIEFWPRENRAHSEKGRTHEEKH